MGNACIARDGVPRAIRMLLLLAFTGALVTCGGGGGGSGGGSTSGAADLALTQISFTPTAVQAGKTIQVSDAVQNQGASTASSIQVRVYLSDDASLDANDLMLGTRSIASLAAGAISTGARTVVVPVNTTPGTYFVGARAGSAGSFDDAAEDGSSRVATGTLTVEPPDLPDLFCDTVLVMPSTVNSGETIDVSDTVRNRGIRGADSFQVAVFLSKDANISASDVLLGVRGVPSLAAGAVSTATDAVTIPPATTAGAYRIGVVADHLRAIVEVEELNNTALWSGTLQVLTPPRPDLVVQAVGFAPGEAEAGTPLDVSEIVANIGVVAAPDSTAAVYLSADDTITGNDIFLGAHSIGALLPSQSSSAFGPVSIPADTEAGSYSVGIMADFANTVGEYDESNNTGSANGTLIVTVPPRPDLAIDFVSFHPPLVDTTAAGSVHFDYAVTNVGVLPSAPFRVGAYLSSNTVLSMSDLVIGFREYAGLAVGETLSGVHDIVVPQGVSAGSYYVGVIADDDARVLETSEANNIRLAPATLDVVASPEPQANLVVSAVTFSPHQTLAGGTLQMQSEVRNTGTLSAGTFKLGLFLSTDESISADDVRLGERTIHHLGIGFGSASSAPYAVPGWIQPGTYFVGALADETGTVAELNEDDNALKAVGSLIVLTPPSPLHQGPLISEGALDERRARTPVGRSSGSSESIADRARVHPERSSVAPMEWITFEAGLSGCEPRWYAHELGRRVDLYADAHRNARATIHWSRSPLQAVAPR